MDSMYLRHICVCIKIITKEEEIEEIANTREKMFANYNSDMGLTFKICKLSELVN